MHTEGCQYYLEFFSGKNNGSLSNSLPYWEGGNGPTWLKETLIETFWWSHSHGQEHLNHPPCAKSLWVQRTSLRYHAQKIGPGESGRFSWLSVRLTVSAQVMVSGVCDEALRGDPHSVGFAWDSLSPTAPPSVLMYSHSLSLSNNRQINLLKNKIY